ncbi:MAG: VCBS repeat-containing protein, partial [Phaeodactylibacter sp.]|nr:VCBS repeat-containing protein [Phaeodactylibacter sp.]
MKRIAPTLLSILFSTVLFGQFSDPMVINPGFNTLEKTVAFDIGNDGRTDLIALVDNEIRWLAPLEDQPDRYILKQALPAGPSFAKPIWMSDLDHDGDADILTIIQQLGTYYLAWYTYDGAGFFKPFELIEALPGKPTTWATGNLDPDPS